MGPMFLSSLFSSGCSKMGFMKVKAPNSHNRKRLAVESRRHASSDDSHMFIIKLPPNLHYYTGPHNPVKNSLDHHQQQKQQQQQQLSTGETSPTATTEASALKTNGKKVNGIPPLGYIYGNTKNSSHTHTHTHTQTHSPCLSRGEKTGSTETWAFWVINISLLHWLGCFMITRTNCKTQDNECKTRQNGLPLPIWAQSRTD